MTSVKQRSPLSPFMMVFTAKRLLQFSEVHLRNRGHYLNEFRMMGFTCAQTCLPSLCFPCLPLWPVMPGSKWERTDPGTLGSMGSSEWCLRSACQSWSWAWYRSCWLWELLFYKVAWWRTGLESGALGGARSAAASARPIHLLATPVTAKQTVRTSPPYSQEPPGSKRSPKQRHW